MAAEIFEQIFVVLDDVSLDESRKVVLLIKSLIAREARDKKQIEDAFFIWKSFWKLLRSSLILVKKVTVYFRQMVMHFRYVLNFEW